MLLTLLALAQAADCPDVTPVLPDTAFDGTRLVRHDAWFQALDDPKVVPLAQAGYDASLQGMGLTEAGITRVYPVDGIAWHHVVNDVVGEVPIAVTF